MTSGQPFSSTIPRRIGIGSRRSVSTSSSDRTRAWGSTETIFMGCPPRVSTVLRDLLQPEAHVHLAVQRLRRSEVPTRLIGAAGALVERAETEMTVSHERTHTARLGERQRLAVEGFSVLGVTRLQPDRDV